MVTTVEKSEFCTKLGVCDSTGSGLHVLFGCIFNAIDEEVDDNSKKIIVKIHNLGGSNTCAVCETVFEEVKFFLSDQKTQVLNICHHISYHIIISSHDNIIMSYHI